MRLIHLQLETLGREPHEFSEYAEIRNGEVRITNSIHAIRFPQSEIFGGNIFDRKDIYYFKLRDWQLTRAFRALTIEFDKVNERLRIKDQTSVFTTIELIDQFDLGFVFPNIDTIWPQNKIELAGFRGWGLNAFELFTIQRILIPNEDYDAIKLDKVRIRCMEKSRYVISYAGKIFNARALLMGWDFNPNGE